MADVTISALTPGTPTGNNIVPYSTGTNTLGVPVSAMFQGGCVVGIGTAAPVMPDEGYTVKSGLEIYNNITAGVKLTTQKGYSFIRFADNNFASNLIIDADRGSTSSGSTEMRLDIRQVNVMRLQTNRVTITQPLDVNGTIKATALQVPGCAVQVVYLTDSNTYDFPDPGTSESPLNLTSTFSMNLKSITSRVHINVTAYGVGYRNSTVPGWGLHLLYNGESMLPAGKSPFMHMYTPSSSVDFISGTLNIMSQHTPGILNPTYRLAIQKPSLAGAGKVIQQMAYCTITEITQ